MAVPKKKVSRSRRDQRRSHSALPAAAWNECPQCGETKRPHHVCTHCGFYRDRSITEPRQAY